MSELLQYSGSRFPRPGCLDPSLDLDWQSAFNLERKVRPKKFKCDVCGAGFSNNGQLRGHIRIHTGWLYNIYIVLPILL